jgi:hypothetical protein|tara:strand:+ start:201 stop:521 length:321 start_codon:yes stop_codon:yes gene_type:complete
MNFPIIESISGLLAAIAAYFSIRAKKEAGEANNAVNHTDSGSPRLYDLALSNYKGVTRIKERQASIEKTVDKLEENQNKTLSKLRQHETIIAKHERILDGLSKKEE